MTEAVWTTVRDPGAEYGWQPALEGVGVFDIWFETEDACVEFIKSEILGAQLASECQPR